MTDDMITGDLVKGLISEYMQSLLGLLRVMAECPDLRSIAVSFRYLECVYLLTTKFILLKGERSGTSNGRWKSETEKNNCSPEMNSLEYFKEFVANPDAFPLDGERKWLSDMIKEAARVTKDTLSKVVNAEEVEIKLQKSRADAALTLPRLGRPEMRPTQMFNTQEESDPAAGSMDTLPPGAAEWADFCPCHAGLIRGLIYPFHHDLKHDPEKCYCCPFCLAKGIKAKCEAIEDALVFPSL